MSRSSGECEGLDHSEPIHGTGKIRYELVKVPPAAVLTCTMISSKVHGLIGHWNGHATRPHSNVDCEGCKKKKPFKWNGYFFATRRLENVLFIVQIPSGPYPAFLEYQDEHGSLAGCRVRLWRAKRNSTAQVSVNILSPDLGGWVLPKIPDIRQPLERIFFGGYKNASYAELATDSSPQQTQFTDDLPRSVEPVELSNPKKACPKQEWLTAKEKQERYGMLKGVSDDLSVNGHKKKEG